MLRARETGSKLAALHLKRMWSKRFGADECPAKRLKRVVPGFCEARKDRERLKKSRSQKEVRKRSKRKRLQHCAKIIKLKLKAAQSADIASSPAVIEYLDLASPDREQFMDSGLQFMNHSATIPHRAPKHDFLKRAQDALRDASNYGNQFAQSDARCPGEVKAILIDMVSSAHTPCLLRPALSERLSKSRRDR